MSKSLGNTVEPQDGHPRRAARRSCACGRRWSTTPRTSGSARPSCRPRSTPIASSGTRVRYLLGALAGFDEAERGRRWPTCRRWSASSCTGSGELDGKVRAAYEAYEFQDVVAAAGRLLLQRPLGAVSSTSAATCSTATAPHAPAPPRRRTVMDLVFERLTVWLAPLLAFTWRRPGRRASPTPAPTRCGCSPRRRPTGENDGRGRALGARSSG